MKVIEDNLLRWSPSLAKYNSSYDDNSEKMIESSMLASTDGHGEDLRWLTMRWV